MKILLRSLLLATALVGTASAQTPAPKKAPPAEKAPPKAPDSKKTEVPPQDVEQFLTFFNKFVDTIVAAKEDCAKMTKDINALIDANAALVKKFQEARAKVTDEVLEEYMRPRKLEWRGNPNPTKPKTEAKEVCLRLCES